LNLTIHSGLQWRTIGRISGILLVSLLISNEFLFYLTSKEINTVLVFFNLEPRNNLSLLLPGVAFSFFFSMIMAFLISLFFPKKYAGALYRIEQDLQHVIDGDLTQKISPRTGDDTEMLVSQLNRLINFFRTEVERILYGLRKAHEMSASDTGTLPEQRLEAVRILHFKLVEELKELKVDLDPAERTWGKSEYTVYVGEPNGSTNCPD
jgi:hypothetical protein